MSKKRNQKAVELLSDKVEPIVRKASFPGIVFACKNKTQDEALKTIVDHEITFLHGIPGGGKAQPLDSLVYTPSGYTKMGDLKIGDVVLTPDGGTAKINGIFPQGNKDIFKIEFYDGSVVECCEEHLWKVYDSRERNNTPIKIVNTKYLVDNYKSNNNRKIFSIYTPAPLNFTKRNLLIDPYILGVLLGDGGLSNSNICFTNIDKEIVEKFNSNLVNSYDGALCLKVKPDNINFRIVKSGVRSPNANVLKDQLKLYGLWGHKTKDKFIPEDYLYSSIEDRYELLRGIMDTDGWVRKNGMAMISSVSYQLLLDIKKLVDSLGGNARISKGRRKFYMYKGEKRLGQISYSLLLGLPDDSLAFNLTRKKIMCKARTKYKIKKYIKSITKIESKICQCISIDHPEHLYITDSYIPTHNTHIAIAHGLKELLNGKYERLVLTRPYVEAGEHLGFLPGSYNNKIAPFMYPVTEIITEYVGKKVAADLIDAGNICVVPLAYMRGMTLKKCFVVADEFQNATVAQTRLLLTRIGENSKVVVTGDVNQSDINGKKNGLRDALDRFKDMPEIGMCYFGEDSCVRSGLVAKIEKKYRK